MLISTNAGAYSVPSSNVKESLRVYTKLCLASALISITLALEPVGHRASVMSTHYQPSSIRFYQAPIYQPIQLVIKTDGWASHHLLRPKIKHGPADL